MLGIQTIEQLATKVGMDEGELRLLAERPEAFIKRLKVWTPGKKARDVISVHGDLRTFQLRLHQRLLQAKIHPAPCSHGGVKKRHVVSNAKMHLGQRFGFKTDIANFFPSISSARVCRVFLRTLRCSPEVSRLLTTLCTHEFHLALGLITSPILAEAALQTLDHRLAKLCVLNGMTYSRFVDDITISGSFDLEGSWVPDQVNQVLRSLGYREKTDKREFGEFDRGFAVTGVRIVRGHMDVDKDWYAELERSLTDHRSLACGGEFHGPFLSESQILGKIHFACWVNPNRRFSLWRRFRVIRWDRAFLNALERGVVQEVTKITPRDAEEPNLEVPLCANVGRKRYEQHIAAHPETVTTAPF